MHRALALCGLVPLGALIFHGCRHQQHLRKPADHLSRHLFGSVDNHETEISELMNSCRKKIELIDPALKLRQPIRLDLEHKWRHLKNLLQTELGYYYKSNKHPCKTRVLEYFSENFIYLCDQSLYCHPRHEDVDVLEHHCDRDLYFRNEERCLHHQLTVLGLLQAQMVYELS